MTMLPVKSSNIDSVGYDQKTMALTVKFKSGSTHQYDDVSPEKHAELMKAESVGSHFHKHIRNAHKSSKME